jgi:hypothetical protein
MYIYTSVPLFKPVKVPIGIMLFSVFLFTFYPIYPFAIGAVGFLAAAYYVSWRRPGNGRTSYGKNVLRFPWPNLRFKARKMWRWVWLVIVLDIALFILAIVEKDSLVFAGAMVAVFITTETARFLFRLKLRAKKEKRWVTTKLF